MAASMQEDDIALVRRVLTGDKSAFRFLVERYQNYVFTIALKVVKHREEAEEVAQDVFMKVYKQLSSFEQRSHFSTWLYTVAYRTSLDYVRRKRPNTQSVEEEGETIQLEDTATQRPVEQLQQSDLHTQLQAAMDKLKPEDAALVSLYYFRERSVAEISEITGLSASNIKTRLFRLRDKLRILLSQKLKEEIKDLL